MYVKKIVSYVAVAILVISVFGFVGGTARAEYMNEGNGYDLEGDYPDVYGEEDEDYDFVDFRDMRTVTGEVEMSETFHVEIDVERILYNDAVDIHGESSVNDAIEYHEPIDGNEPVAFFEASDMFVDDGVEVEFTDESKEGDGEITSWEWDFDDGNTDEGENVTHEFYSDDNEYFETFEVELRIEDEYGYESSFCMNITVGSVDYEPPAYPHPPDEPLPVDAPHMARPESGLAYPMNIGETELAVMSQQRVVSGVSRILYVNETEHFDEDIEVEFYVYDELEEGEDVEDIVDNGEFVGSDSNTFDNESIGEYTTLHNNAVPEDLGLEAGETYNTYAIYDDLIVGYNSDGLHVYSSSAREGDDDEDEDDDEDDEYDPDEDEPEMAEDEVSLELPHIESVFEDYKITYVFESQEDMDNVEIISESSDFFGLGSEKVSETIRFDDDFDGTVSVAVTDKVEGRTYNMDDLGRFFDNGIITAETSDRFEIIRDEIDFTEKELAESMLLTTEGDEDTIPVTFQLNIEEDDDVDNIQIIINHSVIDWVSVSLRNVIGSINFVNATYMSLKDVSITW